MNNVIIRKVNLTNQFQRLAATKVVGNFRFRAAATGTVVLLGDDGITQIALERSEQFTLEGVDLSDIQAKGNLGDFIVIIGSTRVL
jgi:hypothetical protein